AGVGIDLTQTAKEFSSLDSFEGRSWLVNKQGIIQISNEKSEIGTKADKIFPIEIMDLLTKENESTPKVLDAISGNKEMYYAIHLLKEEDWFVVYEVSTGMVTKPLITIKLITLISGLLSTIFAILIFSYISNRVAKPIKNLTHVANKIATEGNLDIAINIKQSNEIGKLAKSFQMMTKHLKELYESLEQKVKDRTRELQLTLDDVRKLKEQQDGDYFLTSLLIKPLTYKHQFQENITVNFLVDEKKKFHFKKRDHEIGGDICIVDEITLEDKSYTVYLNADAMGKSIQGAGGVIAMGVVFKSILNRTKIISGHDLVSPERWLKNSFLELQDVFESFDGSMLISLVLGLLDNNTGFNLFINAEHPNPVLYRDGVASFLEPQLNMYKVGTKGFKGGLNLNGIKMQEGDIFIIGSDGKDDIKTREGELNFDENLFLDFVKKGEGEIERIKNKIYEFYEITDDFSLLSVKFSPPAKANHPSIKEYLEISKELLKGNDWKGAEKTLLEAHKVNSKNSSVIKSLINLYRKQNNILKTAEFCEKLSILEPWSDDLLFDTSLYYYKSGNFERSIDFLERLRLRRPTSVRVLNFYTEIYIHKQNFRMALKFNNKALKYEPENEKALKMKTIIEGELEDLS
ncbi:MAG: SpoIIE family protein phosphatase, partial [Leptospiraceae bacterium]|nr:SpoIIE family protein phosphatase [Leptospiraceae bacterium]